MTISSDSNTICTKISRIIFYDTSSGKWNERKGQNHCVECAAGKYSDKEVFAAAKKVQAGQEMMIRGFHEEDIAGRLLQEVELHGGKGEVRAAEG